MTKYSANVSNALLRPSSLSPAIKSSSKTIIKSAVSKLLGSSCLKKPPTGSSLGGLHRGGGAGGGGGGVLQGGGACSFMAFFLYEPSDCGT